MEGIFFSRRVSCKPLEILQPTPLLQPSSPRHTFESGFERRREELRRGIVLREIVKAGVLTDHRSDLTGRRRCEVEHETQRTRGSFRHEIYGPPIENSASPGDCWGGRRSKAHRHPFIPQQAQITPKHKRISSPSPGLRLRLPPTPSNKKANKPPFKRPQPPLAPSGSSSPRTCRRP